MIVNQSPPIGEAEIEAPIGCVADDRDVVVRAVVGPSDSDDAVIWIDRDGVTNIGVRSRGDRGDGTAIGAEGVVDAAVIVVSD